MKFCKIEKKIEKNTFFFKNPPKKVALELRILQYLNQHTHFVESADWYSVEELVALATGGSLLADIEAIVAVFRTHIMEDCEICRGNAFFCELCHADEV
jgi:hypothetical protein